MIPYVLILCFLFTGFYLLFQRIRLLELARRALQTTEDTIESLERTRRLKKRRQLYELKKEDGILYRIEELLVFSGLRRRHPTLTVEKWILGNVCLLSLLFLAGTFLSGMLPGALAAAVAGAIEFTALTLLRRKELQSVEDNLLKYLNFLANYSITAGELTSVLKQVSRYVDQPLKDALLECALEAETTGDTQAALLMMAERIEHPKFRELARNMEVAVRYTADFTLLVESSRRSVREYLRMQQERKGMLTEAMVNMLILLSMSVFALLSVDSLIDVSVWDVLFQTLPGRIALGVVALIGLLFFKQVCGGRRS